MWRFGAIRKHTKFQNSSLCIFQVKNILIIPLLLIPAPSFHHFLLQFFNFLYIESIVHRKKLIKLCLIKNYVSEI